MGANQSHDPEGRHMDRSCRREGPGVQAHKTRDPRSQTYGTDGGKKSRAKPSPPQRPKVTHVTHNSVTLTWVPPRHTGSHAILAYTVEVTSAQERQWKVLTKACQGIRFEARYLEPSVEYSFRVRAENVFGVGKHSMPSEPVVTKEYDTDGMFTSEATSIPALVVNEPPKIDRIVDSERKPSHSSLQRRHSFNVHLDGRVSSILSNSETVLNRSFPVTSTLQRNSRTGSERSQTLTRTNFGRTSLPASRKVSLPILLPGTGTNSVNRLRESRNSLRGSNSDYGIMPIRDPVKSRLMGSRSSLGSSTSDMTSSLAPSDENRKRDSRDSFRSISPDVTASRDGCSTDNSRDEGMCDCSTGTHSDAVSSTTTDNSSDNNNTLKDWDSTKSTTTHDSSPPTDETDGVHQLKENLKNLSLTEEKLKFHNLHHRLALPDTPYSHPNVQKGYYESLENPWEKVTCSDGVSQRIMTAPFCDDVKMALCARTVEEAYPGFSANQGAGRTEGAGPEGGDFRTLQRVLQSNSLIVRAARASVSDIVGVVMEGEGGGPAHLMRRGPLTTIVDEEEEDPVRVTTL